MPLGAEGTVLDQAGTYLRISLLGAPAMLVMLAGVGYLRGRRDTVRPLWVAVGTAALNLILEVVLIYGFGLEIDASAAPTVVAPRSLHEPRPISWHWGLCPG